MKRVFALLLALVLIAALAGCASRIDENNPATTTTAQAGSNSVTGQYKGKTITLTRKVKTNIPVADSTHFVPFQNGYTYFITENDQFAFIDTAGNLLGENTYTIVYPFGSDGRALVRQQDGTLVYIDKTGAVVAPGINPDYSDDLEKEFYHDMESGLWGLKDETGFHLTRAIYQQHGDFVGNLCFVELAEGEHKNVLIDKNGAVKAVMPDDCYYVYLQPEGVALCLFPPNQNDVFQHRLYSLSGKPLNNTTFKSFGNFQDGLAPVISNGKLGLIDTEGNLVIPPFFAMDDNYQIELAIGENHILGVEDGKLVIYEVTRK